MKRSTKAKLQTHRLFILVRHGKAAPQDVGLSDFERVLSAEGIVESREVADRFAKKAIDVDLMLSSPADRALETAHIFAQAVKYPIQKIQLADVLFSSDAIGPMVALFKRLDSSVRTVAVFGHNPSFDKLAAYLLPDFSQSIPKSAIVACALDIGTWADLKKGSGQLQFLLAPAGTRSKHRKVPRQRAS